MTKENYVNLDGGGAQSVAIIDAVGASRELCMHIHTLCFSSLVSFFLFPKIMRIRGIHTQNMSKCSFQV